MMLGKSLKGCGFDVCEAGNGREGLDVLEHEFPNISLVLADWNMPQMNGLEFVKALRSDPRYASIRVMMVTTETNLDRMTLALEVGANEYLMKPFTPEMVMDKLRLIGALQ